MVEQPNNPPHRRIHRYDVILVLAALALIAAFLPDAFYFNGLSKAPTKLSAERAAAMLRQLRLFAPILAVVAVALWWAVRKLAPEIGAHFDFKSKIATRLLQLHFLIFIPTIAYWFFYGAYWLTIPEAQRQQEMLVVPWHNNLLDVVAQLRRQIPEDASVLLILEQPGTISYASYFNAYLYPRKVYLHRREPDQDRITRADVKVKELREAGIGWIITYSGPREFHVDQLRVERIR
jgi:hypothetical protein